jgi:hypothetical protein
MAQFSLRRYSNRQTRVMRVDPLSHHKLIGLCHNSVFQIDRIFMIQ